MAADTLYLETGSTDPAYNLAFEEVVLQNRREGNTLLLWQNDHAVVIGQNQNAEEEINHAFVEAHGIRVVRRMTGGGAVYHDLGNLNYSWMTDVENAGAITYQQFTRPVVEALRGLGMAAEASGRNDILVEGRKVSGTAQRLLGKRILHHGTLLFDSDPEMIAGGAAGGRLQISIQEHEVCALPRGEYPGISADGYDAARLLGVSEGFPGRGGAPERQPDGSGTPAGTPIESGEVRRLGVDLRPGRPGFPLPTAIDGTAGFWKSGFRQKTGGSPRRASTGIFCPCARQRPWRRRCGGVFSSARMWRRR